MHEECHSDERISVHGDCHSDEQIFGYLLERVHVCSPKRNSPKGLSPHNIPGGQDPKPQWGPGPKVQWH